MLGASRRRKEVSVAGAEGWSGCIQYRDRTCEASWVVVETASVLRQGAVVGFGGGGSRI